MKPSTDPWFNAYRNLLRAVIDHAGKEGIGQTVYYDNGLANKALNLNKTSLVYADACQTSSYDFNNVSIGIRYC